MPDVFPKVRDRQISIRLRSPRSVHPLSDPCFRSCAGGSNVERYGNTRKLCLGIKTVMPEGLVINALTGLRKDNTGYDLKDPLIGAEGPVGHQHSSRF